MFMNKSAPLQTSGYWQSPAISSKLAQAWQVFLSL